MLCPSKTAVRVYIECHVTLITLEMNQTFPYSVHWRWAKKDPKTTSTWSYEMDTTFERGLSPQSSVYGQYLCDSEVSMNHTVAGVELGQLWRVSTFKRAIISIQSVKKDIELQIVEARTT